jgi:hypothetical protein
MGFKALVGDHSRGDGPMTTPSGKRDTTLLGGMIGCLILAAVCLVAGLRAPAVEAGEPDPQTDVRFFDTSKIREAQGTATIDSADATWTGFTPILTCTPVGGEGMHDVTVVIDLAKADTGWATTATAETIQFAVQRAVDGTNYRTDNQAITTAISGTDSAARSVTLSLGLVTATTSFKIAAKLSAEVVDNTDLPYTVIYRAPNRATFADTD